MKDSANRYFLSFVVEVFPEVLPKTDNSVGIDLGIKTFATLSNSKKFEAPKPLNKRIKKHRKLKPLNKRIKKHRKLSNSLSKKN
ncbi:MAG: transposase [Trichodesmium sp. St15_bin1_1]|nr:transposase [Trichodesmium sp. St18_bin1]MDE5090037.1 transposase [Trichodesmium sp. St16_bin2-tuft]MDE5113351.1 transposase [Trichodesmium sp. St15_bin1_1]MDE5119830.1 transposase [Trichodesmium sp. St19_bin1]